MIAVAWGLLMSVAAAALFLGPQGFDGTSIDDAILWSLRAPRVLAALVVGSGLAVCGVAMQCLVRNALADPYLLGMTGGASLGAVATLLFIPVLWAPLVAALSAAATAAGVLWLARGDGGTLSPTRLILSGVAVSAATGACTTFLLQVAPETNSLRAALYWTAGSLAAAPLEGTLVAGVTVVVVCVWMHHRHVTLDRLLLGDDVAASLGVDVVTLRRGMLAGVSILTAALVAIAGPVGFVGLIAPHAARLLVGASHRRLVLTSAPLGAALLLVADTVSRVAFAPRELAVCVLTALLGAPFFLLLLRRRSYGFGGVE